MAEDPPLDRTLDPAAFYSLYRGTLAAEDAEGVDPEGLTPQVLRATGGRFFAEVGFDATSIHNLLGYADRDRLEDVNE